MRTASTTPAFLNYMDGLSAGEQHQALTRFSNYPASYHNGAGGLNFCDGHAEIDVVDPRTKPPLKRDIHLRGARRFSARTIADILWLQQRTTAPEVKGTSIAKGTILWTTVTWAPKALPYLIAIPMAIFGVQHFIYLQFVADFDPGLDSWRTFWACFTGVASDRLRRGNPVRNLGPLGSDIVGSMIFLWVALLHTSRIAAKARRFGVAGEVSSKPWP